MIQQRYRCEGHWDRQLNWHHGHTWPQEAILADLLKMIRQGHSIRVLNPAERRETMGPT